MTQRPIRKRIRKYDTFNTGFLRFPFSNFRYSLTLFSKFFASFPHGTCTLSVSHQYLALDGIYHPLRAAFPSNSTRVRGPVRRRWGTGLSPSLTAVHAQLPSTPVRHTWLQLPKDLQPELFPLHSPLLRES